MSVRALRGVEVVPRDPLLARAKSSVCQLASAAFSGDKPLQKKVATLPTKSFYRLASREFAYRFIYIESSTNSKLYCYL
jgi:hypothetical protein